MAKIRTAIDKDGDVRYQFFCPGCKEYHGFHSSWDFNKDFDKPTVAPSILVYGYKFNKDNTQVPFRCHSFITDGKIEFMNDCTHELAGKTIDLTDEVDNV